MKAIMAILAAAALGAAPGSTEEIVGRLSAPDGMSRIQAEEAASSARIRVEGLAGSNPAAFAERVKAIASKRASDAREPEPVVKDVRLEGGTATLVLHDKAELRLAALEKALEGSPFKVDRGSIVFDTSFQVVVSGMG